PNFIRWFENIGAGDTGSVGGKNASLGEMVRNLGPYGITVPPGFAITAEAYHHFLWANNLEPLIAAKLAELKGGKVSDAQIGLALRAAMGTAEWPKDLAEAICHAYRDLSRRLGADEADVAVRSSATAEDLPEASFAGQQETFLNIRGADNVLEAIRHVFPSLYNDPAILDRLHQGFAHGAVGLSAAVQQMVRSDLDASGVLFTLDTESGFRDVVFITSAYGLGGMVGQGAANPDEF